MRIQSSDIAFDSRHRAEEQHSQRAELKVWTAAASAPRPDTISLSERAIQAAALPSPDPGVDGLSPELSLVRQVLQDLLGVVIDVYQAPSTAEAEGEAPSPPPGGGTFSRAPGSGGGYELSLFETRTESERLDVAASGRVQTADGRTLRFDLSLSLQRTYTESRLTQVREGAEAVKKDPLVINLSSAAARFEAERIEFDLDADGAREFIPNVTAASGYLALDRNGNGAIDDGGELFGARSGNGFAELAALDDDGNGWIDEADAAYGDLRVWRRDGAGSDRVQTLSEAGVGALHLGSTASPFQHRDAENKPVADVVSTGVYLKETGEAGSLQQLDYYV